MTDTPLDDPELALAIEQALAPFEGALPAATLAHMRREMAVQLSSHPQTAAMLRQLRPDPVVQESGKVVGDENAPPLNISAPRPVAGGRGSGR
jgi:hypothetical protein